MQDNITQIIIFCIQNNISVEDTKKYVNILTGKDNSRVFETRIGVFAEDTGNYKTVCVRCSEQNIETIGDLYRLGGREFRKHHNVGAKTAELISDTLQLKYGINDWFSKERTNDSNEPVPMFKV